jgi:hypothetical protein
MQGTLTRLQHVLSDKPVGLHFSGHGDFRDNGYLVFEDNDVSAHKVFQKELKEIIKQSSLQFVFISTCHSQFAGEIFLNTGVEHVICILKTEKLYDKAAIIFSENFYELLFKESLTVCEAFNIAKKTVKHHTDPEVQQESYKFSILTQKDRLDKHVCAILGPFPDGKVEQLKTTPKFPWEYSKVAEFVSRQYDIYKLICCIM